MSQIYNSVQPEALKDGGYGEYDTCDFVLTFENQSLVLDSIKLEGDITINPILNNTGPNSASIDNKTGIHSVIDTISIDTQNQGSIEFLDEYPRYVKMVSETNYSRSDYYNSQFLSELRCDTEANGARYFNNSGGTGTAGDPYINYPPDFCFKPLCALNQSAGPNKLLGFNKTGSITLRLRFRRNNLVLYGQFLTANSSYTLNNLKLSYMTVPQMNSDPVIMKTYYHLKQKLSTTLANLNTKVPKICYAVACSFYPEADLNFVNLNQNETVALNDVSEVVFMFNDSTNRLITYPLKTQEEIKDHYLESLSFTNHNSLTMTSDKGYGIGLNFNGNVDLRNQKINLQIKSNIQRPFFMYMYFLSMLEI